MVMVFHFNIEHWYSFSNSYRVWERVVRKGDTVIDATCGNGYDTLAMLKMVADESGRGRVYGFDVQKEALGSASSLLDESVNPTEVSLLHTFISSFLFYLKKKAYNLCMRGYHINNGK